MPPKDNITLGPGTMYFNGPEGLQPLGEVQEVEFTEEAETFAEDQEPIVKAVNSGMVTLTMNANFKAFLAGLDKAREAWNRLVETLQPMLVRAAKDPRTPRLRHLARYGKNRRIRKKNAKRLFHIMKGD